MDELGHPVFDADNHYYEALDAFTRHVEPRMQPRCVQWVEMNGRQYHLVGGRISHAVVNPTFNPIAKAGAMHDYFRGNPEGKQPWEFLQEREPIPAEYREPAARVARLDEFGLESVWLFPTLGMLYEELLKEDGEAVTTLFTAFNRWLDEDWGCAYENRIFAAPYISLCDVDWAIAELEWALERDARVIVMRPAAPHTRNGQIPVSDPVNDPFWARVNEAGITVGIHGGDGGMQAYVAGWEPTGKFQSFRSTPFQMISTHEKLIFDTMAAFVCHGLYDRHPEVRIASVENGSEFLGNLFKKLRSTDRKMPDYFGEDPVEAFRRNIWINPFWEDDVNELVDLMGADRVIFGSDWPHIEGMPRPLDYATELKAFDDSAQRLILRENTVELNARRPA